MENQQNNQNKTAEESAKIKENATIFTNWMNSLRPHELLDLLMNCGYLLGKTVQPPQKQTEEEKENDETSS